jgi:putative oxidoreductase
MRWLWLPRLLIAGLFIFAGVLKVLRPDVFLEDILNYRLLNRSLAWPIAFYLPMVEIVAGLALLLNRTCRAAAWTLMLCMLAFVFALLAAWGRGLDIQCGCFGSLLPVTQYGWLLLRDTVIISLLFWIVVRFPVACSVHRSTRNESTQPF